LEWNSFGLSFSDRKSKSRSLASSKSTAIANQGSAEAGTLIMTPNDCHQRQDNGKRSAAVGLSAAWHGWASISTPIH
jgi:hypothetical protein